MSIRPLQWPERPVCGQTILLIAPRRLSTSREQLRSLESGGCLVYLVEKPEELQPRWFVGVDELRIMTGTSANEEMIQPILNRLNSLNRAGEKGMLEGWAR